MFGQKFSSWLRQPYPRSDGTRWGWRVALCSGLFVTLFLFFLQPFGVQVGKDETWQWLRVCVEYGLVTMAVTLAWGGLERLLPGVFQEEKWQVWKEIVSTLLFVSAIATANMLYSAWRFHNGLSFRYFLYWQFATWSVGIFPTVVGIFLKQMSLMRRYSTEAAVLSEQLPHHEPVVAATLVLTGENQGETLSVNPDALLYLAAADNYVQIFFLENGAVRHRLLRGTLRRMEDALVGYPQFFRCHRTFLVNLDQVTRITGNAQGYKLHLEHAEAPVPVSRTLNEAIQRRLGSNR